MAGWFTRGSLATGIAVGLSVVVAYNTLFGHSAMPFEVSYQRAVYEPGTGQIQLDIVARADSEAIIDVARRIKCGKSLIDDPAGVQRLFIKQGVQSIHRSLSGMIPQDVKGIVCEVTLSVFWRPDFSLRQHAHEFKIPVEVGE